MSDNNPTSNKAKTICIDLIGVKIASLEDAKLDDVEDEIFGDWIITRAKRSKIYCIEHKTSGKHLYGFCWIGEIQNGYVRVKKYIDRKERWGILDLNREGQEVVPVKYDNIWKPNGRRATRVELDDDVWWFDYSTGELLTYDPCRRNTSYYGDEPSYGRYRGSYAQDVEGYDDDTINVAFEGDPDAYWNID